MSWWRSAAGLGRQSGCLPADDATGKMLVIGKARGLGIEEIVNPLTRNVRCLDKLVDEPATGRKMDKILRQE